MCVRGSRRDGRRGAGPCYCALGAQRPPVEFGARRWQRGALAASGTTLPVPAPKQVPPPLRPPLAQSVWLLCSLRARRRAQQRVQRLCPQCAAPGECASPRVPPVRQKHGRPPAGYTSPPHARRPTTDTITGKTCDRCIEGLALTPNGHRSPVCDFWVKGWCSARVQSGLWAPFGLPQRSTLSLWLHL